MGKLSFWTPIYLCCICLTKMQIAVLPIVLKEMVANMFSNMHLSCIKSVLLPYVSGAQMPPRPSSVQSDGSLHPAMSQSPMAQDRGVFKSEAKSVGQKQYIQGLTLSCSSYLLLLRVYAEKPADASLWLPSVCLCSVPTSVLRGTDASWDGPISAEQLHGCLRTAGGTIRSPRYFYVVFDRV